MNRKIGLLLLVVVMAISLIVAGCAPKAGPEPVPTPAPEGETYQWRAQTLWDAGEISYQDFVNWCARVGELSGGRLTIEPFPAGAIVSYNEAFEAVRNGMFEIDGSSGYASGKDIAFDLVAAPSVLYEDFMQRRIWYYRQGGKELTEELYRNWGLHCIGIHGWGDESLVFKNPVSTLEDFKGLKIRAPEGDVANLMKQLGANVATIPGPDVYLALSTGVIDAADWGSPSMNMSKGFFEVANYFSLPGYHSCGFSPFYMNGDAYDSLPADLQAILTSTAVEYDINQVMTAKYQDSIAIAEMAEMGVHGIAGTPELVNRVREILISIYSEDAKDSELATRIFNSHINFLTEIGIWKG